MAWYASVAKVSHSTSGLTTTITFRVTQRVDGNSYDLNGWNANWSASTGASGSINLKIDKNQTITRDFSVSVNHNSNTGVAPNVSVTVSNLRDGYYISNVVSRSASFQPPTVNVTKVPPQVSNVKLTRNSDSQLTITWTNNGSGNTAPNHNYVDIKTDDGSWVCIHNGGTKTSHVWTGAAANHKYQARVNSGNSAGHNTHVESSVIYTTPATPSISTGRVFVINDTRDLSVNIDMSSLKYTSHKVELQYSNDDSAWKGANGVSGGVYTFTNAANILNLKDAQMDSTLKGYIDKIKDGGKLYLRARAYSYDNSLASAWTDSITVSYNRQPIVKFYIPDDQVYYIYKTKSDSLSPEVYTMKVPKHLLDDNKAISGLVLLACFTPPVGCYDSGRSTFFLANNNSTYLPDISSKGTYTKTDLDKMTFTFAEIPYDWDGNYSADFNFQRKLKEGQSIEPVLNSTQINILSPEPICDTQYTINIRNVVDGSEKSIQFLIPKNIAINSAIDGSNEPSMRNAVNMLDWIYQKGKYISGDRNFINSMRWQIGSYNGGRFYSIGLVDPNDKLLAYLDGNAVAGSLKLQLNTYYSGFGYIQQTGNWIDYQEENKELLGKKDPQIYLKI